MITTTKPASRTPRCGYDMGGGICNPAEKSGTEPTHCADCDSGTVQAKAAKAATWLPAELKAAEARSGSPIFAGAYRWARQVIDQQPPTVALDWIEDACDKGNPQRMSVTVVFEGVADALRGKREPGLGWL